jgi:hypothetical protein
VKRPREARVLSQEIHVTSSAIADIQRNLGETFIPALRELKGHVDSTSVPFPGFGSLGLLMIGKYGGTQNDVRGMVDDAIDTVEKWIEALETIKKNWVKAELNSTVVYK